MSVSLAPTPQDLPTKFDAAFGVALSRLQDRYAPRPNPVREVVPALTALCPLCGKWAHQEGNRFYHVEIRSLSTRERDESRSLFCERVISGIETDGSDATDDQERPTDQELNEHFLTIKGWTRSDLWIDPLSGMTYLMADALDIQNRREDARNG